MNMKKMVLWQAIMTIIALTAFFVILPLRIPIILAILGACAVAAITNLIAHAVNSTDDNSTGAFITTVGAFLGAAGGVGVTIAIGTTLGVIVSLVIGIVAIGIITLFKTDVSPKAIVISYCTQFTIIIIPVAHVMWGVAQK
jgi:hypothetical protein